MGEYEQKLREYAESLRQEWITQREWEAASEWLFGAIIFAHRSDLIDLATLDALLSEYGLGAWRGRRAK